MTLKLSRSRARRCVRRKEHRRLVPPADTTIYEMERRGEFPRRIFLTSRCVAWELAEVEEWLRQRRMASDDLPSSAPGPNVRLRRTRPVSGKRQFLTSSPGARHSARAAAHDPRAFSFARIRCRRRRGVSSSDRPAPQVTSRCAAPAVLMRAGPSRGRKISTSRPPPGLEPAFSAPP